MNMSSLEIYAALCVVLFASAVVAGAVRGIRKANVNKALLPDSDQHDTVIKTFLVWQALYSTAIALSSLCILIYSAIK